MKERFFYIDVLAAISCFAVVCLHCNGVYWLSPHIEGWWAANLIESIFYFGAPIFFMISGCTLIDYRRRYDTKVFLKKRVKKVLIPFLFWLGVSTVVLGRRNGLHIGDFVCALFTVKYMKIYWFFFYIMACYLCFPILGLVTNKRVWFAWIIAYSFIVISVLGFVDDLIGQKMFGLVKCPFGGACLMLALIGYWVDRYELRKKQRVIIYALGVAGFLSHFLGTYYYSLKIGEVSTLFKGYENWPAVFYATAVFVWAKYNFKEECDNLLGLLIRKMRECSFGIYLLHEFVIIGFTRFVGVNTTSIMWRLVGPILIILILIPLIQLAKRSRYGTLLLP